MDSGPGSSEFFRAGGWLNVGFRDAISGLPGVYPDSEVPGLSPPRTPRHAEKRGEYRLSGLRADIAPLNLICRPATRNWI